MVYNLYNGSGFKLIYNLLFLKLSEGAALRQERSPRRRARRVGDPSPYNPFKNYNPF